MEETAGVWAARAPCPWAPAHCPLLLHAPHLSALPSTQVLSVLLDLRPAAEFPQVSSGPRSPQRALPGNSPRRGCRGLGLVLVRPLLSLLTPPVLPTEASPMCQRLGSSRRPRDYLNSLDRGSLKEPWAPFSHGTQPRTVSMMRSARPGLPSSPLVPLLPSLLLALWPAPGPCLWIRPRAVSPLKASSLQGSVDPTGRPLPRPGLGGPAPSHLQARVLSGHAAGR